MKKLVSAALLSAGVILVTPLATANPFSSLFKSTGHEDDPTKISSEAAAFAETQPSWSRPFMKSLYQDGEWGAVLNLNRLGLAAMEQRQFPMARKAFDQAIARVEAIYAEDPNAVKARSAFNAEKVKDFKGEPYERAMMYYYRGLLYLEGGDYQNARAAFLAADRHDTLSSAENQAFAGDFGMMKYLAGWASHCDGDPVRAEQLIQEAQSSDSAVKALPLLPTRSLVLVDSGPAPVKWGDGEHKHLLKFKAGDGDDAEPTLRTERGATLGALTLAGDVTYQATTRGGREVDSVMAGKAQLKDTANVVGTTAFAVGTQLVQDAGLSGDRSTATAGLAGMFIGLIAKGLENATQPQADVRAWDTLPARVLVRADSKSASSRISMITAQQASPLPIQATHGACSIAWGRTRSALPVEAGGHAVLESGQAAEGARGSRNRAFRAMLSTELIASE